MLRIKDVLNVELQDDAYVTGGGIAFVGETVEDFADDCMLDYNESVETLNKSLKECGVKQLPTEKEIKPNVVYVVIEDGLNGCHSEVFAKQEDAWNSVVTRCADFTGFEYGSKEFEKLENDGDATSFPGENISLFNEGWDWYVEAQTIQ